MQSIYQRNLHKVLKDNNVKIAVNEKNRAIDTIFIKKLWITVKYENVYLQNYSDGIALYNGLKKYFEFYNEERFQLSLNYKMPSSVYFLRNAP